MLIPNNGQSFDWIDQKGNTYYDDCPFFEGREVIGELTANNEVTNYELSIYVNDHGSESTISVPLSDLNQPTKLISTLASKGLLIKSRNAKDASEMLMKQAQALMKTPTIKHTLLGLYQPNSGNQRIFLQEENIVGLTAYKYDGKIKLHNGNKQEYETFLHNTVFQSRNLTLAYIIGMSAPIVSLLSNAEIVPYKTILINFAGKSSTGKSTSARLALSPFGNPAFNSQGLGITQSTTENAIYGALDGVHGLPRVLDDINQNIKLNMEQLIYSTVSSEAKRRLGTKYQGNGSGWSGTVIVTSETPIILETAQKGGVQARTLTLELDAWTASAKEAELVNSESLKNYGWIGQEFVDHLLNDSNYLSNRYEVIRQEIDEKITIRDSLTDRIVTQIAAIALTADCYLRNYPNAFAWSYLDIIQLLIDGEQTMVKERDTGERILDLIREFISTNKPLFNIEYQHISGHPCATPQTASTPVGEIINVYDDYQNLVQQTIYIYGQAFQSLMRKYSIHDYKAGLNLLKSRGVLKCDTDGRLQTKHNGIRAYCFILIPLNGGDDDAGSCCYA